MRPDCRGTLFAQSPTAGLATKEAEAIIMPYDLQKHIDVEAWQARDEFQRIESVLRYHQRNRIRLPNARLHAVIHSIVENQVALGDTHPVSAVLSRLMEEGLDRHDAVHAIGSVLCDQLFAAAKEEGGADINAQYQEQLNHLTAESWRKQADDPPG